MATDRAADLGGYLYHVALYVGVVGALFMAADIPLVATPGQTDQHGDADPGKGLAASAVGRRGLNGGGGIGGCVHGVTDDEGFEVERLAVAMAFAA